MEKSPTKTWSLFTDKVSVPYLKINTQVLCGAVKSSRSLCLLRGTSLCGSVKLLHYVISNVAGLNFTRWLGFSKMPQGAYCCAPEGR